MEAHQHLPSWLAFQYLMIPKDVHSPLSLFKLKSPLAQAYSLAPLLARAIAGFVKQLRWGSLLDISAMCDIRRPRPISRGSASKEKWNSQTRPGCSILSICFSILATCRIVLSLLFSIPAACHNGGSSSQPRCG